MNPIAENTFDKGVFLDVSPSKQPAGTMRGNKNFRVITKENQSYVLTNIRGTEQRSALKTNYVPLAIESMDGIAYILSTEVVGGVATGRGEVGCFPSPNYSNGNIDEAYRAIRNYAGDTDLFPSKDGEFNSIHFGFSLSSRVSLELQKDYDGSVNLVFTDGINPIRIINSGFAVLPDSKYILPDRNSSKETNRYAKENFENTIRLLATTNKIARLRFDGCLPGGQLKGGNYHYFFKYYTADGNPTDIIAESMTVSVFHGEIVSEIRGARGDGEATSKLVKFTISHLDQSYNSVRGFFTYSAGVNEMVQATYEIDADFPINGDSLEFTHTGFETVLPADINQLNVQIAAIDTAKTISQNQGYLLAGNIKQKTYDYEPLRKFARQIFLGEKTISLDVIGTEENLSRITIEPINQTDIVAGTSGYNAGYANPKNIYEKLGHWGGESYPYAVRYIMQDGTLSPLFPAVGLDNYEGSNPTVHESKNSAFIDGLDATNGFGSGTDMINNRGIYRFKKRSLSSNNILDLDKIKVNGVTFKIPSLSMDLGDGKTILDYAIGVQFFRGERKADVITQAHIIDTIMVPVLDFSTDALHDYSYSSQNSKFIPAMNYILEGILEYKDWDKSKKRYGIAPVKFNLGGGSIVDRNPRNLFGINPFAMYSTDFILNPAKYSQIMNMDYGIELIMRGKFLHQIPTKSAKQDSATHFSVIKNYGFTSVTRKFYQGQTSWVPDQTANVTKDRFTGRVNMKANISGAIENFFENFGDLVVFDHSYNSYVGLSIPTTEGSLTLATPESSGMDGMPYLQKVGATNIDPSYLVNIYPTKSVRSQTAIQQVYQNIDSLKYHPISGRMYFSAGAEGYDINNTLEGQLDGNRKITLFGGDCFIGPIFRRLCISNQFEDEEGVVINPTHVGYTMSFVGESNHNPHMRGLYDAGEEDVRSFAPYYVKGTEPGDVYGANNKWRDYRLAESTGYSKGYSQVLNSLPAVTFPLNSPFIQSNYFSRIWASEHHIPNSFNNAFRRFMSTFQDYTSKLGQIIRLVSNNNQLYCIQERGVSIIPMNERVQTGTDSVGGVYVQSSGTLSQFSAPVSELIGSRHPDSIIATDNAVYGYSEEKDALWQIVGNRMTLISERVIGSLFSSRMESSKNKSLSVYGRNVVAGWDQANNEVYFTFFHDLDDYGNAQTFTVAWSESDQKFFTEHFDFIGLRYFNLNQKLYSFNVKDSVNRNKIWRHESPSVNRSTFYGQRYDNVLTFVVNDQSEIDKVFNNLVIAGNRAVPYKISYRVMGGGTDQLVKTNDPAYYKNNASYYNGNLHVVIPKVQAIDDQDVDKSYSSVIAGAKADFKAGAIMKGGYLLISLHYNNVDLVQIEKVFTAYETSEHSLYNQ